MNNGFFKVACAAPELRVGDCDFNLARILETAQTARRLGVQLLVLPELCITGATCGDLFSHGSLLSAAKDALMQLTQKTTGMNMIIIAGAPVMHMGAVYNCAAVLQDGDVQGLVPKACAGGQELSSSRVFAPAPAGVEHIWWGNQTVPFGLGLLFQNALAPELVLGVEIGSNRNLPCPPSALLCAAGATVIASLHATPENALSPAAGADERLPCGYISASAGPGESTTDHVYAGRCAIYECGEPLDLTAPFEGGMAVSELDLERIAFERILRGTPRSSHEHMLTFFMEMLDTAPTRVFDAAPFIPKLADGWRRVLDIQTAALAKRLSHTGSKTAVIGVSGGLDSTLALIVAARAFESLAREKSEITAVTMPCFGTSETTLSSARRLCSALDIDLMEIDITAAVRQHFADIGHSGGEHDAAFENTQARERTQILMDIANMHGGFVVGTGDMSESALGWSTYNGDHMSMYGVNSGVPKTLVRHVLAKYAASCGSHSLRECIEAVLETPVSPELLPAKDGQIAQMTEDLVGPYDLHDFFLYYMLSRGFGPKKLYAAACAAFSGRFDAKTVRRWLEVFLRRFFAQQYKRSCMPDGPAVCGISLSPRAGLLMPSDAHGCAWLRELDTF